MTYTIPDFGPDDLLSSDFEGVRRVKTASMSATDVAALNGKLYSFSVPYSLSAGESAVFNVKVAGKSLFYRVEADGLTLEVMSQESTGVGGDIYPAYNLNFSAPNGFKAFIQRIYDFTLNGYSPRSCMSPCEMSIVADESSNFSVVAVNNTGQASSGYLSITLESLGDYLTPFGISPDASLTPTTEMSVYG